MTTSANLDTLSTFVSLLNDVQACDKALTTANSRKACAERDLRDAKFRRDEDDARHARRERKDALDSIETAEKELRDAQRKFRKKAREVRVYSLDGTFIGYAEDKSRALDTGVNEEAYERQMRECERQNEAVAAALYECGQLDF